MQKKSFFDGILPWIVWTTFFITLAIVGQDKNGPTPEMNPRSMTAIPRTQPAIPDCRGTSLR